MRDSRLLLHRLAAAYGPLVIGVAVPVLVMLGVFAGAGALGDLYRATITYNLVYSGETYRSAGDVLRYLVTFPVQHAWIDSLWWMGGLGCADPARAVDLARRATCWCPRGCSRRACRSRSMAAAACRSTSCRRGRRWRSPRASGCSWAWRHLGHVPRTVLLLVLATGIWRVTTIPKAIDYTRPRLPRPHRRNSRARRTSTRFGRRESGDKSQRPGHRATRRPTCAPTPRPTTACWSSASRRARSRSPSAQSASRFFWSRPVIVGVPGGHARLRRDAACSRTSTRTRPRLVVLQRHDWDPDGPDSYSFFMNDPRLRAWLDAGYAPAGRRRQLRHLDAAPMSGIPDTINGATAANPRRVGDLAPRAYLALFLLAIVRRRAAARCVPARRSRRGGPPVGVVWHDEGAWTHNARNRALLGTWPSPTTGTRCTSRRSSPHSSTPRSRPSVSGCGRPAWCRCSRGSSLSWRSALASRGSAGARRGSSPRRCWRRTTSGSCTRARR